MAGRGRGRGRGALNLDAIKKPGGLENCTGEDTSPDSLIERCIEDWHYSPIAAEICAKEMGRSDSGTAYRSALLGKVQQHYKDRLLNRENDPKRFLGTMSLLCQVFARGKSADGAPFKPLVEPVVEVTKLMLDEDASNREVECSAAQLKDVVPVIGQCDVNCLQELRGHIRKQILESRVSRGAMIDLLDGTEAICVLLNR